MVPTFSYGRASITVAPSNVSPPCLVEGGVVFVAYIGSGLSKVGLKLAVIGGSQPVRSGAVH